MLLVWKATATGLGMDVTDTAGLPISYKLGHRRNLFCRGPISNPRPVLASSAQTTRGMLPDFFCNLKTEFLHVFVSVFYLVKKSDFQGFLGTVSDL